MGNYQELMIRYHRQAKAYGRWLREFLFIHSITAGALAQKSHYHHNVIRNWMRGRNLPNGHSMVVVATQLSKLTPFSRPEILESMAAAMLEEQS